MRRPLLAVLVLTGLLVMGPSVASEPDPEPRAVSLHASARGGTWGKPLTTNGHDWVGMSHGSRVAEVTMPPQVDAVVVRNDGGRGSLLDGLVTWSARDSEETADGNLWEGTAVATSRDETLAVSGPGVTITVESMRSVARARCDDPYTAEEASAGSTLVDLRVNGEQVVLDPSGTHGVELPDGRGSVEIRTLVVEPAPGGWTTAALVVRYRAAAETPVWPLTVEGELRVGVTTAVVDCRTP